MPVSGIIGLRPIMPETVTGAKALAFFWRKKPKLQSPRSSLLKVVTFNKLKAQFYLLMEFSCGKFLLIN